MKQNNLLLIKQTIFLGLAILSGWIFGFWYNYYDYGDLWLLNFIALIIYLPLIAVMFIRNENKGRLKIVNRIFRTLTFLLALIMIYIVIEACYYESNLFYFGIRDYLYYIFIQPLSLSYWADFEYGFIYDAKNWFNLMFFISPYILTFILGLVALRFNLKIKDDTEDIDLHNITIQPKSKNTIAATISLCVIILIIALEYFL